MSLFVSLIFSWFSSFVVIFVCQEAENDEISLGLCHQAKLTLSGLERGCLYRQLINQELWYTGFNKISQLNIDIVGHFSRTSPVEKLHSISLLVASTHNFGLSPRGCTSLDESLLITSLCRWYTCLTPSWFYGYTRLIYSFLFCCPFFCGRKW